MPRFVTTMEKRKKHDKDKRREFVEVQKRMTEQVVPSKKKYNRKKEKRSNETRI